MSDTRYLFRDTPTSNWLVKLNIPQDVQFHFDNKAKLVKSTLTPDIRAARIVRDRLIPQWKDAIREARTGAPIAHLLSDITDKTDKLLALESLRSTAIDIAIDTGNRGPLDSVDRYEAAQSSLDRCYTTWLQELTSTVSPATQRTYKSLVQSLFEQFPGEADLKNKRQISNRLHLTGGTAATKRLRLAAWRSYIAHFERITESDRDILQLFDKIKITTPKDHQKRQHFELSELNHLLAHADRKTATHIRLAYYTGARISELKTMSLSGPDKLVIHGTKTSNASRTIPIHPEALQHVSQWLSEASRSPLTSSQFSRFKTSLGYGPEHTFHSIRHTFIRELSKQLVHPSVMAALVGHAPDSFTERTYSATVDFDHLLNAIRMLPPID